ncbi:hypothetical protein [Rubrimonas cliftonensis]|uniref:Uncharacterized protein n=1 Tax=Rubrimonas cliftonensis TaxID=89524 RepID=A0A1H4BC21_9RHOB|nr:hypothetical protein [Rubrimonas cliftonensis]SEA45679.1 hypothetical protein SAMN05444370_105127 [Rubrimonas cliftonensis]
MRREDHDIRGEDYEPDPRMRRLRVLAQLIDKPLFVLLVMAAFALAARGPGLVIDGYRPSGWFVLGLWLCLSVAARLMVLGILARFRARCGLTARRAAQGE